MSEAGGEEIPRTVTEDTGLTPKEETKDEEKKKEGAKDEEKKKEGANDDEKKKEEDEVKRTDNEAEVTGDELKNEANVVQHSIPEENVRQKPREIEVNQPSLEDTEAPTTTTIRTDEKDSSSGADAVDKPEKKDLKSKGDDGQEEEMDEKAKDANAEETKDERKSNDALADKGESSPTEAETTTLTMPTSNPTETTSPSTTTTTNVPSDETTKSSTTSTTTIAEPSSHPIPTSHVSTESTASTVESNSNPSDEYAEHITYTTDGNAIYTDPKTKHKYKWCPKENNWIYWTSAATTATTTGDENPYENEHYKWCSERNEWIPKAQKTDATTHTATAVTHTQSQTETEHYKWDAKKNAWIPKVQQQQSEIGTSATVDNGDGEATVKATTATTTTTTTTGREDVTYGIDEDGQRIYTDRDGAVFFWDATKSAWFPKIDDDFMARYQMNYGFIDNTSASEAERRQREEAEAKRKALELQQMAEEARAATEAAAAGGGQVGVGAGAGVGGKRKAPPEPPKWFELNPEQNTKVYVSNLPLDITLDEFAEVMSKCGMIMRDPQTQKYKLKLYTEADGQIKGDGLCDYIKVESVELALKILDEYEVRGHKIRVQRAKFQMRGEYNPALKPKRKKKDKEKLQKMKEKLFDWRPEKMRGERSKNEKVVIIKNLFTPEIFEKEVQLILDYQNDLREECSKCGTVRKVVIYDLHAEGVAQVNMSSPEEADLVIQMMQGRFFGKRQLTAEHWDGKTKYKIAETENAVKSRLSNWDQFLETDEDKQPEEPVVAATPTATEEDK